MNKDEFAETMRNIVAGYIAKFYEIGSEAQLSINPVTKFISVDVGNNIQSDIADAEEAVEEAAGAENPVDEDFSDYQAEQNPDFYPLRSFVISDGSGAHKPDDKAIVQLIDRYFPS